MLLLEESFAGLLSVVAGVDEDDESEPDEEPESPDEDDEVLATSELDDVERLSLR